MPLSDLIFFTYAFALLGCCAGMLAYGVALLRPPRPFFASEFTADILTARLQDCRWDAPHTPGGRKTILASLAELGERVRYESHNVDALTLSLLQRFSDEGTAGVEVFLQTEGPIHGPFASAEMTRAEILARIRDGKQRLLAQRPASPR